MPHIKATWGYWEEYNGNAKGNFQRTAVDIPVTSLVVHHGDIWFTLPNGKRGHTSAQAIGGQHG